MAIPTATTDWPWEGDRAYLSLVTRLHLPGWLQAKIDAGEVVEDALAKAGSQRLPVHECSNKERADWLRPILLQTLAEAVRRCTNGGRGAVLERWLQTDLAETSRRLEVLLSTAPSPDQHALSHEDFQRFAQALEALPPDQRTAVALMHLHGLSVAAISLHMGRSKETVGGLLRRGTLALRACLREA
jgi:RNA polymerase sigma factor (sigma-70 family)